MCISVLFRTLLFNHCESNEEGTRNVVAECLGKLTLIDPTTLLGQLQVQNRVYGKEMSSFVPTGEKFAPCLMTGLTFDQHSLVVFVVTFASFKKYRCHSDKVYNF